MVEREIPMASSSGLVVDHSAVFSRIQGVCDDVGAVFDSTCKEWIAESYEILSTKFPGRAREAQKHILGRESSY